MDEEYTCFEYNRRAVTYSLPKWYFTTLCNMFFYAEDGIYCELNQQNCLTYAIPLGCGTQELKPLTDSLWRQSERLRQRPDAEASGPSSRRIGTVTDNQEEDLTTYVHTGVESEEAVERSLMRASSVTIPRRL